MSDAPEQIGKGGEKARAVRLEVVERLQRFTKRRERGLFGMLDPQPRANRLQRHDLKITHTTRDQPIHDRSGFWPLPVAVADQT